MSYQLRHANREEYGPEGFLTQTALAYGLREQYDENRDSFGRD